MAELPQNWIEKTLDKVCIITTGRKDANAAVENGNYMFFTCAAEPLKINSYIVDDEAIILPGNGANVGMVLYYKGKLDAYQRTYVLYNSKINTKYLYYYLKCYWYLYNLDKQYGSATNYIRLGNLTDFNIKIAPENEQKRIAKKLDTIIPKVDKINSKLERIPTILKRARQSILNQAITGELTKEWRKKHLNINTAKTMLDNLRQTLLNDDTTNLNQTKLNEIYDYQEEYFSYEIPDTWCFSTLEKLCKSFKYGTSSKSDTSGLIPVLRMGNLQNGEIDWNDLVYTSDQQEIQKYNLNKNDVLFNRTNSPELVGKTAIYRGEQQAIYAGYLIKIENYSQLNSEYLNYALNSTFAIEWKLEVKTDGVSQSNINAQKLAKYEISLPPIEEQEEIVRQVKTLFGKLDKIEESYKKAKQYTDKINQSVLHKAFTGNLVPQDPNDKPVNLDEIHSNIAKKLPEKRIKLIQDKVYEMTKEIIEILEDFPEGLSPEELFKKSKYSKKDFTDENIIEFYKEISKLLDSKLTEEKDANSHKTIIKKVK